MPVDFVANLRNLDFHQSATAGACHAVSRLGGIGRAMRGAHEPLSGRVEKSIRLEIELHRHVRAAIQVGQRLAFKSHRKSAANLPVIHDLKGHSLGRVT